MTTPRAVYAIQPHRIQEEAAKLGMQHGDTARVKIPNVGVEETPNGGLALRFCYIGVMEADRHTVAYGDGRPLPPKEKVKVELKRPLDVEPGQYNLVNALFNSNGQNILVIDEKTQFLPVENVQA